MKTKQIFCGRKNGATVKGRFHPAPNVSTLISERLVRTARKAEAKLR